MKKLDEKGVPVFNPVTEAPVHTIEKLPGLELTHLLELLRLYNVLRENDAILLAERGGEKFRAQAERTIRRLAREASKEQWSVAKLRTEIKRIKDPSHRTPASDKPAFVITKKSASIDLTRTLPRSERDELAAQLTAALVAFGFKTVVITDAA